MKTLFGALSICVGAYFAAFAGCVLIRNVGYPGTALTLDWCVAWSPFVSLLILILIGFRVHANNEASDWWVFWKIPVVCLTALIPLMVHLGLFKLTFAVDPPPVRLWGPLSPSKWVILVVGCLLIGIGTAQCLCSNANRGQSAS